MKTSCVAVQVSLSGQERHGEQTLPAASTPPVAGKRACTILVAPTPPFRSSQTRKESSSKTLIPLAGRVRCTTCWKCIHTISSKDEPRRAWVTLNWKAHQRHASPRMDASLTSLLRYETPQCALRTKRWATALS